MLLQKPPIWNLQPGLVARPWREHWRGAKAVFPMWEAAGGSVHPWPRFTRWGLNNGATRRLTRYGPAVYFPGSSANEVETTEGDPIAFAAGEPYTLALLILWKQNPGTEGIFRSGSSSNGDWLWMTSSGKLWGRHADVNSPASGNGPIITTTTGPIRGRACANRRAAAPPRGRQASTPPDITNAASISGQSMARGLAFQRATMASSLAAPKAPKKLAGDGPCAFSPRQ
jgi:hypothetical protein